MESMRMTLEETLAVLAGKDIESFRKTQSEKLVFARKAERLRDLHPDRWPRLYFNWSLQSESWHHSFDAFSPSDLRAYYPEGLRLGWVQLSEFDEKLCSFNKRRDTIELWSCGCKSKLAVVIAYLAGGGAISPVVAALTRDGQLCLHGGNHRYTAAKFSGEREIPIICSINSCVGLSGIVKVRWVEHGA